MSILREENYERDLQLLKEEIFEKARAEAREKVHKDEARKVAIAMLKNDEPLEKVIKYCGISEDEAIKLAESIHNSN